MNKSAPLVDAYLHKGLREKLVIQLRDKGITDENVLSAIGKIPRHFFLDSAFDKIAYEDRAFPIAADQTISQPYTVAYQTQLLQIKKGDKVLEIGTGSGYQAAVLIEMGVNLVTIERQEALYIKTKKLLTDLGMKANFILGDGSLGKYEDGPFDKIIVTAGAPKVPMALVNQLKIGGIMIIPVGNEEEQIMHSLVKKADGEIEAIPLTKFRFVPLIGEQAW